MLISDIRKILEKEGTLSAKQISFFLKEETGMIEAGLEVLISKGIVEGFESVECRCKGCAFRDTCREDVPASNLVYRITQRS